MAIKLILHGRVQGVFCRAYCAHYARKRKVPGSVTNLPDGTVRVILDTEDDELVDRYIADLRTNPEGFGFYGRIDSVDVGGYRGAISGEYRF